MDYILEKKIRFNSKKDKTLYSWCLDELSNQDKNHQEGLIPYPFSNFFNVSSLRLVRGVGSKKSYSDNGVTNVPNNRIFILGEIKPSPRTKFDFFETSYSMFGTDRLVDSISLKIEKLGDDSEDEICTLWGSPVYKSEIDFREYTEPDNISVTISLKTEQFEGLVRMLETKSVGNSQLILGQVDGFYAPWSPSINARSIKVLTEYHEVEGEIDLDRPIPIIGNVGEFYLSFSSPLDLEERVDEDKSTEDEILVEKPATKVEIDNSKYLAVTDSLKKPLWWILFVLVLILLNQ
jgi:hypothetical protein